MKKERDEVGVRENVRVAVFLYLMFTVQADL